MSPQLDKALRQGGMSRRGFLRAMGVTTAALLVPGMGPGLMMPVPEEWMPCQFTIKWEHHFPTPILDLHVRRILRPPVEIKAYLVGRNHDSATE